MLNSKYGNKKVVIDGHKFDSIAESKYYLQLKWLKQANQIKDFKLQPRFLLQDSFKKDGRTFRKIEYVADFEIHHLDGSIEVVDVKGMETEAFKLKKKLFENKYPHKLSLITYSKIDGGWVTLDDLKKYRKARKKHGQQNKAKKAVKKGD